MYSMDLLLTDVRRPANRRVDEPDLENVNEKKLGFASCVARRPTCQLVAIPILEQVLAEVFSRGRDSGRHRRSICCRRGKGANCTNLPFESRNTYGERPSWSPAKSLLYVRHFDGYLFSAGSVPPPLVTDRCRLIWLKSNPLLSSSYPAIHRRMRRRRRPSIRRQLPARVRVQYSVLRRITRRRSRLRAVASGDRASAPLVRP
jgi:hypothetical protein